MKLTEENNIFFKHLSEYLNLNSRAIGYKEMRKFEGLANTETIYKRLLTAFLLLNGDFAKYLKDLTLEDVNTYKNNPYYQNIKFETKKFGKWELGHEEFKPYELFVKNDYKTIDDLVCPSLGFFDKPFKYPAVYQNNRMWMSITPNEINTMEEPIKKATGNVLTFGLGLGYFSYMASLKDDVKTVTIVERDSNVINLFTKIILPQFKNKDKIIIINEDCYEFLNKGIDNYDYTFVDIYHDCSDGVECYKKMKDYFKENNKHDFWIYESIKYYL